jgi:hypothetical protein
VIRVCVVDMSSTRRSGAYSLLAQTSGELVWEDGVVGLKIDRSSARISGWMRRTGAWPRRPPERTIGNSPERAAPDVPIVASILPRETVLHGGVGALWRPACRVGPSGSPDKHVGLAGHPTVRHTPLPLLAAATADGHFSGWESPGSDSFRRRFGAVGSQSGTTNEPVTSSFLPGPGWGCKEAPAKGSNPQLLGGVRFSPNQPAFR